MMSPTLPMLLDTAWLAAHLDDPDLRILDCSVSLVPVEGGVRLESGRGAWAAGHLPHAGYADLLNELSDPDTALPMMMPPAAQFAAAMSRYGIGEGTRVVLYDTAAHTWATRLWWMLRAMGFDAAAVLDGGLNKWKAEGRPLSTASTSGPPGKFQARPRGGVFVAKQDVKMALESSAVRLVNALSADEHAGRVSRTQRPGRIPGSVNVPAASLVDPASGAFREPQALREQLRLAGLLDAPAVIAYCGGGIAATSVAFNLIRLGAANVSVYDGSLVEWSADPSLPLETG
jgi:thiosulfate/3-mercaptopyruvate sulfurtransferase